MTKFVEQMLAHVGDKLRDWGHRLDRKSENLRRSRKIREYHASRGPVGWVTVGQYKTQSGRTVMVRANTTGWFDGLPWVIIDGQGRETYTVDDWGRLYEDGVSHLDLSHPVL